MNRIRAKATEMKAMFTPFTLLILLFSAHLSAETINSPHIEITGYGEVVAKPDMAEFRVQVEESTLTAEDAKSRVDSAVTAFIERLTAAGVAREDISATNIRLTPRYNYPQSGKSELIGYQANRSISVKVFQLDRLNEYLDWAIGDGINRIDSIQLRVKDEEAVTEQARLAALRDAENKASSLAQGLKLKLGKVWRVSYNNVSVQPVMMKAAAMDARAESAPSGYQDSSIVIRDRVQIIYKLNE